jgi:hypothetical protein
MVKAAFQAVLRVLTAVAVLIWTLRSGRKTEPAEPAAPPPPKPDSPETESQKAGHEVSEPSPKAIVIFVGCFLGTILLIMAALGFLYVDLYRKRPAAPVPEAEASFHYAPNAETSIARDWEAIDEQAHRRLETYGWVDRKNGITRIPIERATQLIAHEGLPARPGAAPAFPPPDRESRPLMETEKSKDVSKSF